MTDNTTSTINVQWPVKRDERRKLAAQMGLTQAAAEAAFREQQDQQAHRVAFVTGMTAGDFIGKRPPPVSVPSVEDLEYQYMQGHNSIGRSNDHQLDGRVHEREGELYKYSSSLERIAQLYDDIHMGWMTLSFEVAGSLAGVIFFRNLNTITIEVTAWALLILGIVTTVAAFVLLYKGRNLAKEYTDLFYEYHTGMKRSHLPSLAPAKPAISTSPAPGVMPVQPVVKNPPCVCSSVECCGACTYDKKVLED